MRRSSQIKLALLQTALILQKMADLKSKQAEEERIQRVLSSYVEERSAVEDLFAEYLQKFFLSQAGQIIEKISALEELPAQVSDLFDLKKLNKELFDLLVPLTARTLAETAMAELKRLGANLNSTQEKSVDGSDWIGNDTTDTSFDEIVFNFGDATISMGFLRDYPEWMKKEIQSQLRETFEQDYWKDINEQTLKDIEKKIFEGVLEGQSIASISSTLSAYFVDDGAYSLQRARLISRTEIGHVLNAARSMSMDALIQAAGPDIPMKKQWRSVLSLTTRDTHANLDGVPADQNNRWLLGGVYCRWPGDTLLPAKERCNCQCTIVMTFGLSEEDIIRLIESYSERLSKMKFLIRKKEQRNGINCS